MFWIKVRSVLRCLETYAGVIHFIFAPSCSCQHGGVNRMGHVTAGTQPIDRLNLLCCDAASIALLRIWPVWRKPDCKWSRGSANILWLSPVLNKYEQYPADQAICQPAALDRRRTSTPHSPCDNPHRTEPSRTELMQTDAPVPTVLMADEVHTNSLEGDLH